MTLHRNIFRDFDDMLLNVLPELINVGKYVKINRINCNDTILELQNVSFTIKNPLECITFPTFAPKTIWCLSECIGELLNIDPYLFIERYNPGILDMYKRKNRLQGYTYGARLHSHNQIESIYQRLKNDINTRQAILIFSDPAFDTQITNWNISCTLTTQFLYRDSKLHSIVNMRSMDIARGMKYDTFFQGVLLEMMAGFLGVEIGTISYNIGSFHVYSAEEEKATDFVTTKSLQESAWENRAPLHFECSMEEFFDIIWRIKRAEDNAYWHNYATAESIAADMKFEIFRNWAWNFIKKNQGEKDYLPIR